MRTFELTTHLKAISRSDDRSTTAAAAYRACCVIECEREGRIHDYTRKHGLEASAIVLPAGSPRWAHDRAKLWNEAELVERNGKRGKNAGQFKANAQTARDLLFSLPVELSAAGRLNVARIIARHQADTHGVGVDFAIHQPGQQGDERNFHVHMLMTTRRLTEKGLGEKAREWDDLKNAPKLAKALRAFIAQTINDELKAEGQADAVFVEHRSFKARGNAQAPTQHQGVDRTNVRRNERGHVMLIATGRGGREAFDRLTRDAQRAAAEFGQVQGLKREIQAERNQFVTGQTQDRAALIERHGVEDRQLRQTSASREFADRAAERQDRQPRAQTQTREQERAARGAGQGP